MANMFKGMQNIFNKTKKDKLEKALAESPVTPVLTADDLLASESRQRTIKEIRDLMSLPDEEFDQWFLKAIRELAEFTQNLPETARSFYASVGGLLDHALERTSLALFLCRTYLLPQSVSMATLDEPEMLWVYAVFTASLYLDIGKVATHHLVTMTDAEGNENKRWLPFAGSMVSQSTHYVYGFNTQDHEHMRHLVTPLLARQLIPAQGFNWIAGNPEVLQAWLAMLADDQRQMGSLMTVIPLADAQILEGYFSDRKVFRHSLSPKTIAFLAQLQKMRKAQDFIGKQIDATGREQQIEKFAYVQQDPKAHTTQPQSMFGLPTVPGQHAHATSAQAQQHISSYDTADAKAVTQAFINWFRESVAEGKISVNQADSNVVVTDRGVLIDKQVLQNFVEQHPTQAPKTPGEVQQILLLSGVMTAANVGQVTQLLIQNPHLVLPFGHPGTQAFPIVSMTTPAQAVVQTKGDIQQAHHAQEAHKQQEHVHQQQIHQALSRGKS